VVIVSLREAEHREREREREEDRDGRETKIHTGSIT